MNRSSKIIFVIASLLFVSSLCFLQLSQRQELVAPKSQEIKFRANTLVLLSSEKNSSLRKPFNCVDINRHGFLSDSLSSSIIVIAGPGSPKPVLRNDTVFVECLQSNLGQNITIHFHQHLADSLSIVSDKLFFDHFRSNVDVYGTDSIMMPSLNVDVKGTAVRVFGVHVGELQVNNPGKIRLDKARVDSFFLNTSSLFTGYDSRESLLQKGVVRGPYTKIVQSMLSVH